MSYLFSQYESLKLLTDISKGNTSKVNDMSYLFSECKSLLSLPDISKWKAFNVTNMQSMFFNWQFFIIIT